MTDFGKTRKADTPRRIVSAIGRAVAPRAFDSGHVVARSAKAGRFADGVRIVADRDRKGLIKLADR